MFVPSTTKVEAVDKELKRDRSGCPCRVTCTVKRVQSRMKKNLTNTTWIENLKLVTGFIWDSNFIGKLLSLRKNLKLSPRFYGPFKIIQKLDLLQTWSTSWGSHPLFHVTSLKKQIGTKISVQLSLPVVHSEDKNLAPPQAVLDCRMLKRDAQKYWSIGKDFLQLKQLERTCETSI